MDNPSNSPPSLTPTTPTTTPPMLITATPITISSTTKSLPMILKLPERKVATKSTVTISKIKEISNTRPEVIMKPLSHIPRL